MRDRQCGFANPNGGSVPEWSGPSNAPRLRLFFVSLQLSKATAVPVVSPSAIGTESRSLRRGYPNELPLMSRPTSTSRRFSSRRTRAASATSVWVVSRAFLNLLPPNRKTRWDYPVPRCSSDDLGDLPGRMGLILRVTVSAVLRPATPPQCQPNRAPPNAPIAFRPTKKDLRRLDVSLCVVTSAGNRT